MVNKFDALFQVVMENYISIAGLYSKQNQVYLQPSDIADLYVISVMPPTKDPTTQKIVEEILQQAKTNLVTELQTIVLHEVIGGIHADRGYGGGPKITPDTLFASWQESQKKHEVQPDERDIGFKKLQEAANTGPTKLAKAITLFKLTQISGVKVVNEFLKHYITKNVDNYRKAIKIASTPKFQQWKQQQEQEFAQKLFLSQSKTQEALTSGKITDDRVVEILEKLSQQGKLTFGSVKKHTGIELTFKIVADIFKNTITSDSWGKAQWPQIALMGEKLLNATTAKDIIHYFDRLVDMTHHSGSLLMHFRGSQEGWLPELLSQKQQSVRIRDMFEHISSTLRRVLRQDQDWQYYIRTHPAFKV